MTIALSDLMRTTFAGGLGTLQSLLTAAEEHAATHGMDVGDLLQARLSPDMFTFVQQLQAASDTARRVTDRVSGREPGSMPDPEPTVAALQERLRVSLDHLEEGDVEKIDAATEQKMTVDLGAGPMEFTGRSYVLGFALPNFMFHVTTAYAILRQRGLPLGKVSYVSPFVMACQKQG